MAFKGTVMDRLERARSAMVDGGVDLLLIGPGADLRYLVGYHALPLERLTLLVLPVSEAPRLVVPVLEEPRARASGASDHVEIIPWGETTDPIRLVAELPGVADAEAVAVDDRLWATFTFRLQDALSGRRWSLGSSIMSALRMVKDQAEVAALRMAGEAIDHVHGRVPELLTPGRTERSLGKAIADLIRGTHDEVAFVIVAAGPNGASPHHELSDRRLEIGDPIVVDIGGVLGGYCSDATRNYCLGPPADEYVEVHAVLEEAQQSGVAAVRPGVTAEAVDIAARDVIAQAGYGEWFVHRTGHGIGLEEHEEPWIMAGNDLPLREGMTFSVEPGIYLPGRYGARIEDIVAVTGDGVERLNHRPRELTVVTP